MVSEQSCSSESPIPPQEKSSSSSLSMSMASPSSVIQITAATHFPIKLTATNFPVWRKQVQSTLIGLGLDSFITGTTEPPPQLLPESKPNPAYTVWYRQDQIIISAILGSCSEAIQPLLSSANTAHDAWNRLTVSYANTSRSRIISLKSKLTKNPKGSRSVAEFLHEMRTIADELALVQSPISDEDLMVHILAQLGEDYTPIAAAIKVRENPLSYPELFDKLVDFERSLKEKDHSALDILTANNTQRHNSRPPNRVFGDNTNRSSRSQPRTNRPNCQSPNSGGQRHSRSNVFCQYCNIPGHETRDCRKLARFLKENHVTVAPIVNSTTPRSNPNSPSWMFDTGASDHIITDKSTLHPLSEYGGPDEVVLGNGNRLSITHTGNTKLCTSSRSLTLSNVLCVPNLKNNLISVAKLCRTNRVSVEFFPHHFFVKDLHTGASLLRGENIHDVYYTNFRSLPQLNSTTKVSFLQLHHKLGHPSTRILRSLLKHFGINSNNRSNSIDHCESCLVNKSHKLPFGTNSFVATKPLQLIYSDVWGPVQKSIDGFAYYVIFVDFYSKYVWLYPMKHKSDVSQIFPQFKMLVEKYFQTPLISLFTDNGGEYLGLAPYLKSMGISHFTTPPHTPEQNGIAERRHRHVVETGLALLHFSGLPFRLWSHAFQMAVYLINRLPTKVLESKSPFEVLHGRPPNYSTLKPFGCLCYPWLRPYSTSKLQPKSTPCVFLGYSSSKSAYKCYDPKTHRLFHSRHVRFIDHVYPSKSPTQSHFPLPIPTSLQSNKSSSLHQPTHAFSTTNPLPVHVVHQELNQIQDPMHHHHTPLAPSPMQVENPSSISDSVQPSHSHSAPHSTSDHAMSPSNPLPTTTTFTHEESSSPPMSPLIPSVNSPPIVPANPSPAPPPRTRKPNPRYFNSSFVNTSTLHPIPPTFEPSTLTQAMKNPKWREAMDSEFNALLQNGTWELVPRSSQNTIGCKWVFRVKRNPDGSVAKYKARLVAKGFLQQYGRDYFDTFSPVTKPVTIRTILSIALSKNWPLRQLDVNNAFLHGTLHEEVYMVQPPGYTHPQYPNHICKLRKSLYGLKQAPRAWYIELANFLLKSGFKKSLADASLFIYSCNSIICYFMVYVDDIVITGNNNDFLSGFIEAIARRFSIKDLGSLHHFLGIEVLPTKSRMFLTQHRHIHDILVQCNMEGAKNVVTPCASETLNPNDGTPPVDPTPYRKIVGSLQYLAFTRPDISFAVNKLSQFMHAPSQKHWQALKRVLRYLKGTIHFGLFLNRGSPLTLTAFSDSDWGGISDGGRSTTAYLLYLGPNIISWRSSRQKSVSRSSTEAEYKALANAAAEVLWVKNLLRELGIHLSTAPTLHCDNTGATYLCANPVYHSRMKHVALDYHFVREQVSDGSLRVLHINSKDQLADVLTKPLSRQPFLRFRSKIGVSNGASILRGRISTNHGESNTN